MARNVYLDLRERGDALRAAGVDWADDLLDALDAAEAYWELDKSVDALAELLCLAKNPRTDGALPVAINNLKEEAAGAGRAERVATRRAERVEREAAALRAFMASRGLAPPPPTGPNAHLGLGDDDIPF